MGFMKKLKVFLDKINVFDWYVKSRDYERLSGKYTEQINKNMRLTEEVGSLGQKINNLSNQLTDYQQGIENNPEYKELEVKATNLEKERDHYKSESEERGGLINHLKAGKNDLMNFVDYVIKEKHTEPLISFLENDSQPYVLFDAEHLKIINYTKTFAEELGLKEDIRGKDYLTIFNTGKDGEKIKALKRLLRRKERVEFDDEYRKNGKIIPLHITKKLPVSIKLDLNYFGKRGSGETIVCVPLVVEKLGKWKRRFHHGHSLEEVMEETKEEIELAEKVELESSGIYAELITYSEWRDGRIPKVIKKMGRDKAYLYLKGQLSELKKREEKRRKVERRKSARERLKRIKSNKRRPKNIVKKLKKKGMDNERLMGLIKDESLDYQGFRDGCANLVREYRRTI